MNNNKPLSIKVGGIFDLLNLVPRSQMLLWQVCKCHMYETILSNTEHKYNNTCVIFYKER